MKQYDKLRMVSWLLMAVAFYALAMFAITQPQLQTALWKCGHITVGGFLGYWLDRNAMGRVTNYSTPGRQQARAVIVGATILAMALGL